MSTLEILIAFAILTLTLSAVIMVVFGNQSVAVDVETNIEGISKAQAQLEQARALSRQNFDSVSSIAMTPDDIYQKGLTVTASADGSLKTVTSSVTWTSLGRLLGINFTTLLANPFANTCNPQLSGVWTNPKHYDFNSYDLISPITGNNSNGLSISDLKVYHQKLYLAASDTANAGDTFYVFNLPENPAQMPANPFGIDNAPTLAAGLNALAIAPSGNKLYAYVASAYTGAPSGCTEASNCAELQVIDVTTPSDPAQFKVVRNLKIPAVTTGNNLPAGKSLAYNNGYVYLGLVKVSGGSPRGEFNIIDVGGSGDLAATPLTPKLRGTYKVGRTINSMYIKGNYAYLATDDNSGNNKQLLILDVSDKDTPRFSTTAPFFGGFFKANGNGFGYGVKVAKDRVYLARSWSSAGIPNFYILDGTNPASSPNPLPTVGPGLVVGSNDSVNGLDIRGDDTLRLAFLVTNSIFTIKDVTQPTNIQPYATIQLKDIVDSARGTNGNNASGSSAQGCTGNYFYIVVQANGNNKDIVSIIGPGS